MARKPIMLIVLDGWGMRAAEHGNAVQQGNTPNFDNWMKTRERAIVHTSGEQVGLVPRQMGNSEVGHLNLGAGRIVYQDISRIANAIEDGHSLRLLSCRMRFNISKTMTKSCISSACWGMVACTVTMTICMR